MGDPLFDLIFTGEGAAQLTWEVASRCVTPRADGTPCWAEATKQPAWDCLTCGGLGVVYAAAVEITGLFRGQSRWTSRQPSGEHGLGEAALTTRTPHKPGYVDERVRDRFTVLAAVGDVEAGRVFYPAAQAIPFIFDGEQEGWRIQLQGLDQSSRVKAQA